MTLNTYTFDAPAHWASALINGDLTSFDDADEAAFNAWLADHADEARDVVGCEEHTFIGRFNGLQTELLTYQALRSTEGD
jgi:hypothetical protein